MSQPVYSPSTEFVKHAHVKGLEGYRELYWKAKWFVGRKTNASCNCIDLHPATHRKNKVAILSVGCGGGPGRREAAPDRRPTLETGSFAKPEQIRFADALPKTRSG